jgi:hypothetical protein
MNSEDFDHDASLDFPCPICKVEERSQCVMRNGLVRNTSHTERMDLARVRAILMYRMLDMKPN